MAASRRQDSSSSPPAYSNIRDQGKLISNTQSERSATSSPSQQHGNQPFGVSVDGSQQTPLVTSAQGAAQPRVIYVTQQQVNNGPHELSPPIGCTLGIFRNNDCVYPLYFNDYYLKQYFPSRIDELFNSKFY